ncbi:hypothetical protein EQ826_00215 [Ectopseudomonas mendocina]|nr:hypothetical protein [Pseudomonas mendocina]TRO21982.1 hypothetical protein EQ828_12920 [Pseudomonas mendocina]TRO29348.1 hypothetical protein EQ826_00215 [Pseudomonas mendocina]
MNPNIVPFLLGLAIGLLLLIPVIRLLRGRYKARGYARGHQQAHASQQLIINDLHKSVQVLMQQLTDKEQHMKQLACDHRKREQAMVADCEARIQALHNISLPYTAEDRGLINQAHQLLHTAASFWAGTRNTDLATKAHQACDALKGLYTRIDQGLAAQKVSA